MSNLAHSSLLKVKMRTHFEMPTGAYAEISHIIIIIIPHVLVQCLIMKLCTDIFYVQAGQAWTGIKKEKMHFHSTPHLFLLPHFKFFTGRLLNALEVQTKNLSIKRKIHFFFYKHFNSPTK